MKKTGMFTLIATTIVGAVIAKESSLFANYPSLLQSSEQFVSNVMSKIPGVNVMAKAPSTSDVDEWVAAYNSVKEEYPYECSGLLNSNIAQWEYSDFVPLTANEYWNAQSDQTYYEQTNREYGSSSWSHFACQTMYLPKGKYMVCISARAAESVTSQMGVKVGEAEALTVALPNKGNRGWGIDIYGNATNSSDASYACSGSGYGWEYRYIEFEVSDDQTPVLIALSASTENVNQWVSIAKPKLFAKRPSVIGGNMESWTSSNHEDGSTEEHTWTFNCTSPNSTLVFDWAVSSEDGCDYLKVYLDNNQILSVAGELSNRYEAVIPEVGTHILRAVYSKDGSVNNGQDQASITIVMAPGVVDCVKLLSNAAAVAGTLTGFTAAKGELQTSIDEMNSLLDEGADIDLLIQKADQLDSLCTVATAFKNEYEKLSETVALNKEVAVVLADADLSAAVTAAEAIVAAKTTLTTDALESIVNAGQAISQIVDGMNLVSTKVWDFNISQQTIDGLNYDYNHYGNWGYSGNCFYTWAGNWNQYQLAYYGTDEQTHIVPETEGLFFIGGDRFYIFTDGTNRLRTDGSGIGYTFMIPDLVADQELKINYTTTSNGSTCGINSFSNNVQLVGGLDRTTGTAEATYRVVSGGAVAFYPYNRSIYINSISVTMPNDPLRLAELRKEVAGYISTLNALPGLKSELQTAYNNAVVNGDMEKADAVMGELRNIYNKVKGAVDIYPNLCADMDSASVVLAEGAYVDVSEALALGQAIDVNTSASAAYYAAYEALEAALAVYNSDQVEMTDWAFNTSTVRVVDGLRYYLDTTNHLAEFIGFDRENAITGTLNIPSYVHYNGESYAVVAVISANTYTQRNITGVKLPKSLRQIGDYGFAYYTNLRYIEFPENVTSMGSNVIIGDVNLHAIKINSVVPPVLSSLWNGSYWYNNVYHYGDKLKITIPEESFHAYRVANVWNNYVLIGGDGVTVSTGKIAAGDLGHIVLDEASYLQEVNKLIIDEGTLNNDDWNTIKQMTNLVEVDLAGVTMANLPSSAFSGRWAIEKVALPHNLTTIGNGAFYNVGIKEITFPETVTAFGSESFRNCDSLVTVAVPNGVTSIPNYCFYDCDGLQKVEMPAGITSIGYESFYSCDNLNEATLPANLASIGSEAFSYCPLKSVEIPAGVSVISDYAFANNYALDSLVIPETVVSINADAFYNCTALESVQFNEGLTNIYSRAFQNCTKLTEIVLPSSLERCQSAPFYGCTGVKKIEARSVIPPTTEGSCPLSNVSLTDVVLTVPSWSTSEYPLADGWSSFYTVEASDFMPQYIKVNKDFYFTLRDTLAADYRPNIKMTFSDVQSTDAYGHTNYERGNLTISGRSKLAVNNLELEYSAFAKYYADRNVSNNYDYDNYRTNINSTSLIVNGEMRAEDVTIWLQTYNSRWQFISFPFDVKVGDITPGLENVSWVIRGHNGKQRAAGNMDSVWENLTAQDTLKAGQGYIMHTYNPTSNNSWFAVSPIKNTVNRQLIFASDDRTLPLEENLAEFDHNRSWNLIGNPYPCFYDSRFLDFDAPFMVWNSYNQNYVAYNPADDKYILSPGEAFFVQRPYEQEEITFRKEGRQTHRYAREMEVDARARVNAAGENVRTIYNLTLQQDSLSDRTRVVFNDAASVAYEMNCDAAKFAGTERNIPQIFTIADKTRFAINERPFANGDVALGIYCGIDGEFTISLDNTSNCKVILEDKLENKYVELTSENAYTFSAIAGEDLTRFVLHFVTETTGVDNICLDNANGEDVIYNIQGIKVNNTSAKGVYIKNGQKTVIK